MLGLSFSAVDFAASHEDVDEVVGGGLFDSVHDQSILFSELRLDARYGITDAISVDLVAPFRIIDMGIVYRDQATGAPLDLANPDIHHRDETLAGFFDPWLLGGYTWRTGKLRLTGKLGSTIPIGKTEEDPFALGDMELPHQHIQFGTGIFAPIVGLDASYDFSRWRASARALTIQSLYESGKRFQPGDRYIVGLAAQSRLGTDNWSFRAGATFQAETAERWSGALRTDEGNQGRKDLLANLEVSRQLGDRFTAHAAVQVPLYNRVVGGQLDYPAIAEVGLTASFELFGGHEHGGGHEHEHGDVHEHGDEHGERGVSWDGIDMVEIARAGEAAPLVPVAGKITVFDFWATWCKPCKKLDARLAALAREYPGKLAIRKLDVVDWDTPATAKYLTPGAFDLPHVKVYRADGVRAFELSGSPEHIAAEVEKLLTSD